jgi:hypothetical protein
MTTITPEQLAEMASALGVEKNDFARLLHREYVITIAPPAPSEAMVKLAREIAGKELAIHAVEVELGSAAFRIALAALQHVEKLVLYMSCQQKRSGDYISRHAILTAIGSNRHD